ncbi:PTS system, mannose-specific IIB component [Humidesulfovibrio mexicanus]|uniref:PTS system, mannose-specific IIB component n=1 Tax=Humidesulfovibrio mexicanus TaxID=147047 RepID=A0A238XPM3_9BACT|nr:PTS sugar transporter subunit IIB [Humidesulfovibrio mexicanus]SNR60284.1 PTS system, mannose-specific IIB component [Humidesulfovibrio mexicanus]
MFWVRVDNRLIHGQVVEAWVPFMDAKCIIVGNDELSRDEFQQEIMSLAIPRAVESAFLPIDALAADSRLKAPARESTLLLFSTCLDVRRAVEKGLSISILNIGNLHYSQGKRQVSPSVSIGPDDEACLRFLQDKGVELDFRCVPNDPVSVRFT